MIDYSFKQSGLLDEGSLKGRRVYGGWYYAIFCYSLIDILKQKPVAVFRLKSLKTK